MRAILSVFDKTGLEEFARGLTSLGVEIFSTGGTQQSLDKAGLPVRRVSELTGFPEILDGRVKTIHPAVLGGILARRDLPSHVEEMALYGIAPIDLVCINLYPFVETIGRPGVSLDEALENIDIGGPTMLRAAAKNFPHVLVAVDPTDYSQILELLRAGVVSLETRRRLAQKAFQHVAAYDTAIAQYLREGEDLFPVQMTIAMKKIYDLRYGENPHQRAALYREERAGGKVGGGVTAGRQLHGKELSYNNILDADAAWSAALDFAEPAVAVVKHTNPCGLACHEDIAEAYRRALAGDPVSAFGGIVAANRTVTRAAAQEIVKTFYEIIIAPDFEEDALEILRRKRDLRLLAAGGPPGGGRVQRLDFRSAGGGLLVQTADADPEDEVELRTVTRRSPNPDELADLRFAWKVVKHIKSNAIVLAKDKQLVGMGSGQPNRVTSVHLAIRAAGERAKGSVLASDAFFPFPDSIHLAAQEGVTAAIQPGGSIRDGESVKAADDHGMAMIVTGVRHFKH